MKSTKSGKDSNFRHLGKIEPQKAVEEIDSIIQNLSDTGTSNSLHRKRKLSLSNSDGTTDGSPRGFGREYNELYNLLHKGLLGNAFIDDCKNHDFSSKRIPGGGGRKVSRCEGDEDGYQVTSGNEKQNVSCLLMGPRGMDAQLLLDRCISELEEESRKKGLKTCPFRKVTLNGILLRGHDAGATVTEITRQLGSIATNESITKSQEFLEKEMQAAYERRQEEMLQSSFTNTTEANCEDQETNHNIDRILQREKFIFRQRRTNFNSSLALLDQVLKTASIDAIPVLIVLEELDAFLAPTSGSGTTRGAVPYSSSNLAPPSQRHVLLYHLLDRVAGHDSLVSLVGLTSHLSTVSMFEKRVRSRAMGTSKVIYFSSPPSFDDLVHMLLDKLGHHSLSSDDSDGFTVVEKLKQCLQQILLAPLGSATISAKDADHDPITDIRNRFKRSYALGSSVRWFCRVLSIALCLFVDDLLSSNPKGFEERIDICFDEKYLLEGIVMMGGSNDEGDQNDLKHLRTGKRLHNNHDDSYDYECVGPFDGDGSRMSKVGYDSHRTQTLFDLSGSEIAVLLAARRISMRDCQSETLVALKPLTYKRIQKEFETQFISKKASGPDRYEEVIFYQSFCNLIDCDIIRVAKDHTGGGIFQYQFNSGCSVIGMDPATLKVSPLHFNIDLDGELGYALKSRKLIDCTTALRDWGMKSN